MQMSSEFQRGFDDYHNNVDMLDNPYTNACDRKQWKNGWYCGWDQTAKAIRVKLAMLNLGDSTMKSVNAEKATTPYVDNVTDAELKDSISFRRAMQRVEMKTEMAKKQIELSRISEEQGTEPMASHESYIPRCKAHGGLA
jgi:hypothetical protein